VPEATLTIAGAGPPRWLRAAHGKDGVEVVADPPDLLELVAAARVALAPLVYSVGVQNKVLEAMGRGVPVVATGAACDGLPDEARGCIAQADDPEAFAEATRWLMTDLPEARRIGRLGHAYARRNHAWETIAERFRAMYAPAGVVRSVA
jgi:glycosyltransferase involved in cell wall biosynthesis